MPFRFKPAVREVGPLLIGLAGGPGSGKTYSSLMLAQGLAGGTKVAVIDSEGGRALFYADDFAFDHALIEAPFTAEKYTDAIQSAQDSGYGVIVVDSASHEYSGEGGLLDQQEDELTRMAGQDWKKREQCKMASWIKPKQAHKKFVTKLLQVRSHLILCFRAEPKIEMARENGKTVVKEKRGLIGHAGWFPSCEKNLPFEMTAYFLLQAENPGVPHPIKIMHQHQAMFPAGKAITATAGRELAEWSNGGTPKSVEKNGDGTPAAPTDESLIDIMAAISDTSTMEGLERLGVEIKGLTAGQQEELRPHYKSKMSEIMR